MDLGFARRGNLNVWPSRDFGPMKLAQNKNGGFVSVFSANEGAGYANNRRSYCKYTRMMRYTGR